MTRGPTKETTARQRYLALQRKARRTGRPTDELIQLYALESFLDRLTKFQYAESFVLKGGVLLAALDACRPTRDIDFAVRKLANDTNFMLGVTRQIAAISLDDGLSFNAEVATGESIRVNVGRMPENVAPSRCIYRKYNELLIRSCQRQVSGRSSRSLATSSDANTGIRTHSIQKGRYARTRC